MDFKSKALKYKLKYFKLREEMNTMQIGGNIPYEWLNSFKQELAEVYTAVQSECYPYPVVITGSTAIVLLLDYCNHFIEDIKNDLDSIKRGDSDGYMPGDFDFIYHKKAKGVDNKSPENISTTNNNFVKKQTTIERSSTYDNKQNNLTINSFDLTKYPGNIKYVEISLTNDQNNIVKVTDAQFLRNFYNFDDTSNTNTVVKSNICNEINALPQYQELVVLNTNDINQNTNQNDNNDNNDINQNTNQNTNNNINNISEENLIYNSPVSSPINPENNENVNDNSDENTSDIFKGRLFEFDEKDESPLKKVKE
jgi:hypothetical protein